ncbi:ABC transporter ATP-binding protein [Cellulomonas sp. NPDC089187]|uniref:ABC transporter ATP-binding protein n=1 Tax=Cellulomonas sp. NPDC089187 TaxID=3154970 RepID=UPI00341B56A6
MTASTTTKGALQLSHVAKAYNPSDPNARAVDDFCLDVEPGQFVTLLGPSGCGKTTTLRMIAGFETPTEGDIRLDGGSLLRTAPNKRPMSMVFQSYALFPHLSVTDNVAFGLSVQRTPKPERGDRVRQVMELMGIEQYAQRFPHELSGGQQQRVALARALVMEPSILLFDEPLSNLDARLRLRMREEIRAIQQRLGITSIFVTHDQSEALTMSDLIVVMKDGRIEQTGTPEQIYHRPATAFVASFLGQANFLPVAVHEVREVDGGRRASVTLAGQGLDLPCDTGLTAGGTASAVIRSEDLHVVEVTPGTTPMLPGRVTVASFDGAITRYTVETDFGLLHGQASGFQPPMAVGTGVDCRFATDSGWLIAE